MKKIYVLFISSFLTSLVLAQGVTIKDPDTNTLLQVIDEGDHGGSLLFSELETGDIGGKQGKLYNLEGALMWSGTELGMKNSAAGWTKTGNVVHLTDVGNNVGIGTTNPFQILELKKDDDDVCILFHDPGDQWFTLGMDYSDPSKFKLNYGNDLALNNLFTIKSSGEVGIGTSNPQADLHVEGSVKIGFNSVVFSGISELTATTGFIGNSTTITLPAGYTSANTRILSADWKGDSGIPGVNRWHGFGHYNSDDYFTYYIRELTNEITVQYSTNHQDTDIRFIILRLE